MTLFPLPEPSQVVIYSIALLYETWYKLAFRILFPKEANDRANRLPEESQRVLNQRGITFHKPFIPTGVEEGMCIFVTPGPRYKRFCGGFVLAR